MRRRYSQPFPRYLKCACAIALLLSTSVGCNSPAVRVSHDERATFSTIRTYGWHPNGNTLRGVRPHMQDVGQLIASTIAQELQSKGWSPAKPDAADVLVAYHLGVSSRSEVTKWGYMDWFGGRHDVPVESRNYRAGTLFVDIVDPQAEALLWRGTATGTREAGDSDQVVRNHMVAAVRRMFASFPPSD